MDRGPLVDLDFALDPFTCRRSRTAWPRRLFVFRGPDVDAVSISPSRWPTSNAFVEGQNLKLKELGTINQRRIRSINDTSNME